VNALSISPVLFTAIGALIGVLFQQVFEIWKTRTTHRQELQRRFFDFKFQTAVDLARALDTLVSTYHARLAEVAERIRDDEDFTSLPIARQVSAIHAKQLETEFSRYMAAFAVLELMFSGATVTATQSGSTLDLNTAWQHFDKQWNDLVTALNRIIPESRFEQLRAQRQIGEVEESAREEMINWLSLYKARTRDLRKHLPLLSELTMQAEQYRRDVLAAIRKELKPYSI
jgi:hypothetical protein